MSEDLIIRIFEMFPGPVKNRFPYRKPYFIQFCKFCIVGITSTLITLAVLYSLTEFVGIYYLFSAAAALLISAMNGYFWNNRWTFKTAGVRRHQFAFSKYVALNTVTYFLNLIVLAFLVETFGIWYIVSEIIAVFISLVGNFLGSKYWVFK